MLLLVAIIAICVVLPLVLRRFADARRNSALIRKNSRTLQYHYEAASDAAQLQKLPPELRAAGVTIDVEFTIEFGGDRPADADRARRAWADLESIGMIVNSVRQGQRIVVTGSRSLPAGNVQAITHVRVDVEDIAARLGGAYAGWRVSGTTKRVG
ncbi:MAG: hypothetical protein QM770_04495 [Tepidisphaeraceae bacterium]